MEAVLGDAGIGGESIVKPVCIVTDCSASSHARGFCPYHYHRDRYERRRALPVDHWKHGTYDRWYYGACRCDPCCGANAFRIERARLGKFKMSAEEFNEKLARQGGGCAVCGALRSSDGKALHVDHDHDCCPGPTSCGLCVRGIICNRCNSALGLAQHDAARLRGMADYLEAHSAVSA